MANKHTVVQDIMEKVICRNVFPRKCQIVTLNLSSTSENVIDAKKTWNMAVLYCL
jgi:hypothetical protein